MILLEIKIGELIRDKLAVEPPPPNNHSYEEGGWSIGQRNAYRDPGTLGVAIELVARLEQEIGRLQNPNVRQGSG